MRMTGSRKGLTQKLDNSNDIYDIPLSPIPTVVGLHLIEFSTYHTYIPFSQIPISYRIFYISYFYLLFANLTFDKYELL